MALRWLGLLSRSALPAPAPPVPWRSCCSGYANTGAWPTHPLLPTRTLYKILDSCKQLTLAQGAGEEDPSGMVTIITGLPLDNPSALSGPMQVGHGVVGVVWNGEEVLD